MHALLVAPLLLLPTQASWPQQVTKRLLELQSQASFPGMTAAWTLPDGTTQSVAVGLSDKERSLPMKPEDRMLAGSIGKMYFAAEIMKMVERGEFDLDRKAAYYLGDWPAFKRLPNAGTMTIRQLLTHSSGVPEHVGFPEFIEAVKKEPAKSWTPEETLAFAFDKAPLFEAGKGWSYADTNYIIASLAAQRAAKKPMYSMIEAEILRPLGLKDTSPSISQTLPRLAQGYSMPNSPFGFTGPVLKDGKYFAFNPQMEWAGGGFISTSADLSRWAKALYEAKLVSPASVKQMIDSAVPARTGQGDKYGIGTQVRNTPFGMSYGHGGWFPGYLSEVEYFPDLKIAVAVQFNTDDMRSLGGRPTKFTREIARITAGK